MAATFDVIHQQLRQATRSIALTSPIELYQQFDQFLQQRNSDPTSYHQLQIACQQLLNHPHPLFCDKLLPSQMVIDHQGWQMAFFESYRG